MQSNQKTSHEKRGTLEKNNCTIVKPKIKQNCQVTEGIASANQTVEGEDDTFQFGGYREKN
jgi:hypothetical protein